MENDMEHSYQLVMLAWYLIDSYHLSFDMNRIMRYCLVHDLVEVYAGDTYIYSQDMEHLSSKVHREEQAMKQIKERFHEFPEMLSYIEQYEQKNDPEALFVYSLDKIIPVLNCYMDDGRIWKDVSLTHIAVTLDKIRENKDEKIRKSPELYEFWLQFVEVLKANQKDLFLSK